jgi:hypothetical protein
LPVACDPEQNRWCLLTFAGHAANALVRDVLRHYASAYDVRINGFSVSLKLPVELPSIWHGFVAHLGSLSPGKLGQFVQDPKPFTTFGRFLPSQYMKQANAEIQYDLHGALDCVRNAHLKECPLAELMRLKAMLERKE